MIPRRKVRCHMEPLANVDSEGSTFEVLRTHNKLSVTSKLLLTRQIFVKASSVDICISETVLGKCANYFYQIHEHANV